MYVVSDTGSVASIKNKLLRTKRLDSQWIKRFKH